MKKLQIILFSLAPILNWGISLGQQIFPKIPPQVQILSFLYSNSVTPEGILGERKISAKFQRQIGNSSPFDITPQSVYLYYSYSENGSIAQNLNPNEARDSRDLGITPAQLVNSRWEVILPHSGNRNGAIGQNVIEFKGKQKAYYKWYLTFPDGKTESTKVANFEMPRPINIAVMGDSYGSGEGAPMTGGRLWATGGNNCHRSENAGEYKAVQQFVASNPHIAVVHKPFFVSCSGAQTKNIIGTDYSTGFCDNQGNTPEPTQLKQLQLVFENPQNYKGDIQGKIDAVVISIGGNDAGFASAVKDAFANSLAPKINKYRNKADTIIPASYDELRLAFDKQCIKYVFTTEYPDPTTDESGNVCGLPRNIFAFLIMAALESTFQSEQSFAESVCDVGEAIIEFFAGDDNEDDCGNSGLFDSPNYDYLMNYIRCNVTNADANHLAEADVLASGIIDIVLAIVASGGDYKAFVRRLDACIPADGSPSNANVFTTLLATKADIAAARNGFLIPMNKIIENKASQFRNSGFTNWHFVDGSMNASQRHGICACNGNSRFFNSLLASFDQQGSMEGTMHMNTRGQERVYQPLVFNKLQQVITTNARRDMFANVCLKMPPLQPMSNTYLNFLIENDKKTKDHDDDVQKDFKKLYDKIKPVANIIITKLDPKLFAEQYKNKAFAGIRNRRLHR
jgi:hypothetical protein